MSFEDKLKRISNIVLGVLASAWMIAQLFFTVGGGIGPLFSGFMADIIGYSFAWGIYLIFTIGYIFLFI